MKYFDAFSGYGGFSLGIQQAYDNRELLQSETTENLQEDSPNFTSGQTRATCIGYSEIDKYAIETYSKHFPYEECEPCYIRRLQSDDSKRPEELNDATNELQQWERSDNCQCKHKNYGDLTRINAEELPDFDLFVGGFPCQAFSIAGKRAGFEDTRGTLIYDVLRIVKEKHPRLVLLENVKGLLSHDSGRTFKTIITALAELGYAVEWQVLNAKNFGVPQNRERVFIIGHLGGFSGRQVFPISGGDQNDTRKVGKGLSATITRDYYKGLCGSNRQGIINRTVRSGGRASITPKHAWDIVRSEDAKIRRLTPLECERLMGLPDGWTEGVSDTQRYKLCGNGVVVNVVEEIIKRLL